MNKQEELQKKINKFLSKYDNESTIKNFRVILNKVFKTIDDISIDKINEFLAHPKLKYKTKATHKATIGTFLKWHNKTYGTIFNTKEIFVTHLVDLNSQYLDLMGDEELEEKNTPPKVLITGTAKGIGYKTARLFLEKGFEVYGLDLEKYTIDHPNYKHYVVDTSELLTLPALWDIEFEYVINNAGTINNKDAMNVNYNGYQNIVEKYCKLNTKLKSLVNITASDSFKKTNNWEYSVSQSSVVEYTKVLADIMGNRGVLVNSLAVGYVKTSFQPDVYSNKIKLKHIESITTIGRWLTPGEIANWIYFVAVINSSMTGQNITIDGGTR